MISNQLFVGMVSGKKGEDLTISFVDELYNFCMSEKFWQVIADDIEYIVKDEQWPINIETLELNDGWEDYGSFVEASKKEVERMIGSMLELLGIRKIILNGIKRHREEARWRKIRGKIEEK